ALAHAYAAAGSYTATVTVTDGSNVSGSATFRVNASTMTTPTPTPTPTPNPTPMPTPIPTPIPSSTSDKPSPVHLAAILFTKKVGKKKSQYLRVTSSAGGTPKEIRSPLQSTAYKGITVVAKDTNGDGSEDSIVVSGTKKVGRKTTSITLVP